MKCIPGRALGKYRGPEAGTCLVCLGNSKEASVAGEKGVQGSDKVFHRSLEGFGILL